MELMDYVVLEEPQFCDHVTIIVLQNQFEYFALLEVTKINMQTYANCRGFFVEQVLRAEKKWEVNVQGFHKRNDIIYILQNYHIFNSPTCHNIPTGTQPSRSLQ